MRFGTKSTKYSLHSHPIYNEKYIKTKVKTVYADNMVPKEKKSLHLYCSNKY